MATPKRNKKKDDKDKKPKAPVDPAEQFDMTKRAKRDVRISIHPQIEALNRLRKRTIADYGQSLQRSNSIFGQELGALAPLAGQFGAGSEAILGNLQQALGAFGGTTGGLGAENDAAAAAQGAMSRGVLGVLGSGQQAGLANLQAARAGAAMQRQEMGSNILGEKRDALDQIMSQRQDVFGQLPALIRQREDELQQSAFERLLANRQFNLNKRSTLADIANNKALQEFLKNNLSALLGGGGNFGGPGIEGDQGIPNGGGVNNPGGRGDTAGHGRGPQNPQGPQPGGGGTSALQAFTSGHRPWAQIGEQGRDMIRENVNQYWINHPDEPAFAPLRHYSNTQGPVPWEMRRPAALIDLLRKFLYGARGPNRKPKP